MFDDFAESGQHPTEMRKSGWIGIRISEGDKQLLQDIAESEGRSLANLCLFIIKDYVQRHDPEPKAPARDTQTIDKTAPTSHSTEQMIKDGKAKHKAQKRMRQKVED